MDDAGRQRPDPVALREVEQRVLWLAVRIVDHANRRGETTIKVGGHQASSASMVSLMTALWFGHLDGQDKVAVKPHASPVYHASVCGCALRPAACGAAHRDGG